MITAIVVALLQVMFKTFFSRDLWSRELASMPTFRRIGYSVTRVAHLTVTNFVKDRCPSRAAALTYITVLSLVPKAYSAKALKPSPSESTDAVPENWTPSLSPGFPPEAMLERQFVASAGSVPIPGLI